MRRTALFLFIGIGLCSYALMGKAELAKTLAIDKSCSYFGNNQDGATVKLLSVDAQTEELIAAIVKTYDFKQNFVVQAAKVDDVLAVVEGDKRYLLYNPHFVSSLTNKMGSSWSVVAIFTHEIGHHFNQHTFVDANKRYDFELAADWSTGSVLQKMGATIDDAIATLNSLDNKALVAHYPAKSERVAAISNGWVSSENSFGKVAAKQFQLSKALNKAKPFVEPEMVAIKGGCFLMGSPESEKGRQNDEKQHKVCVKNFEMGKYEITQAQWEVIMGNNPSHFIDYNLPVELVSWHDAQEFMVKLNKKTGKNYRLPTEAEWEYAARAGTSTAYYWGNQISCDKANYGSCYVDNPTKIGSYPANPWGLHDMIGNVEEWTCSEYDKNYKGKEQQCFHNNAKDSSVVIRGGWWYSGSKWLRSANRNSSPPYLRDLNRGVRISRTR
jgi:formylglycine-generating enzyme required for sulfatase activity